MLGVSSTGVGVSRPRTSGAYLTASALYNAGFRGWPLVVMTAIAGRESRWNPNAVNSTDPAGGSYGLLQINGSHNPNGGVATTSWASQILQPEENARQAFALAGGNSLSNLGPWALTSSPKAGYLPLPTVQGYSIAPYLPTAYVAAQEVGTSGPASSSEIANVSSWPSAASNTLSPSQLMGLPRGVLTAAAVSSGAVSGCGSKVGSNPGEPNQVFTIPHTSAGITYCNLKAIGGGLMMAGGALMMVIGLGLVVVAGLEGHGPAAPVVQAASATLAGARRLPGGSKIPGD